MEGDNRTMYERIIDFEKNAGANSNIVNRVNETLNDVFDSPQVEVKDKLNAIGLLLKMEQNYISTKEPVIKTVDTGITFDSMAIRANERAKQIEDKNV